jgi:hypothetical protein
MEGNVTPAEDTKPYLDQVFMVVESYIPALNKNWQLLNPGYTFITPEVVSFRTASGFNHVYSPSYFYPRVITTVLLG